MSQPDAVLLNAFPLKMVRLACTRCDRKGQYLKATLIEKYGAAVPLPTLRHLIAKCENEGKMRTACGIYFMDLKPKDYVTGHSVLFNTVINGERALFALRD